MKLFRAAEALCKEADPIAAAMYKARSKSCGGLRDNKIYGRIKLAELLGVTGRVSGGAER
jgi:hypothetical protein